MDVTTDPTAAIEAVRQIPDLAERAKAYGQILVDLPKLRGVVAAERQATVAAMHDGGMSWTQIGEAINQHPQRAAQIAKGISGGGKGYVKKAADEPQQQASEAAPCTHERKRKERILGTDTGDWECLDCGETWFRGW
jgi:hypothetical protein